MLISSLTPALKAWMHRKAKGIREIQPEYDLQEMALWNKPFSVLMPPPRDQLLSELGLMDKKKTKVEVKTLAQELL